MKILKNKKQKNHLKVSNIKNTKIVSKNKTKYQPISINEKKKSKSYITNKIKIAKRINKRKKAYIYDFEQYIKYYKSLDSIYNSFWLGKLVNAFIKKGEKSIISKQIYQSLLYVKFINNTVPLLYILEILDKIKPLFKLINWMLRKRRKKKQPKILIPRVAKKPQQYKIALNWLIFKLSSNVTNWKTTRLKTPLLFQFYTHLASFDLLSNKKNGLLKLRSAHYQNAKNQQYTMRYIWKSLRK